MKKVKLLFWLIVVGLIALAVYQNLELFQGQHEVRLDLYVKQFAGEFSFGVMLLALFLAGLLVAYFFSLGSRFRSRKTIRKLNEELAAERKKASELESRAARAEAPQDVKQAPSDAAAGPDAGAEEKEKPNQSE